MIVLWLIEFLLFTVIVIVVVVLVQKVIANYREQAAAQTLAHELMRFAEAKSIVMQQANRQVQRGVPFEQAVLIVLSDDYWPEPEPGLADTTRD